MEFKDYYAVLGVPRDATAEQIKKAWRQLARKYHPDVSQEADAAARMSEINEAHAVLSDPEKRAAYDALARGHRAGDRFTPPPDWDAGFEFSGGPGMAGAGPHAGGFEDFSDFFAELFGRAGPARGFGAQGRPAGHGAGSARGPDHHAKIVLDLEDVWRGATRQVQLRSPRLGPDGRVALDERTLDVRIPPGVRPGQMIRLAGQGGAGQGGAPAGDLFLEVHLRPHPRFRVDGGTLAADLPVAPWEAALGAVVPVTLPDGQVLKVRVPAGAQAGRVLTVRGRGLPGGPGRPAGDLELSVQVVLPSAHDPRARRLYEAMAAELTDFDARAQATADRAAQETDR